MHKPPFFIDLPTQNGQVQPDVIARYTANAPQVMVAQYAAQLKTYKAIVLDVGDKDNIASGDKATHEALDAVGVPNRFELYDGDHVNRIANRFETLVVPFFAQQLATAVKH